MEISISTSEYVSESRRRKKGGGNARSKMLRVIMPHLSRETGDSLANAIANGKVAMFKKVWDKVKSEIANEIATSKSSDEVDMDFPSESQIEEAYNFLLNDMEEKSI